MKTFLDWAKEEGMQEILDLVGQATDAPQGEPATAENTKRAGISANYPDAYVRSQYPHKYFNPITATADGKLQKKMGS